jgi:hypothetical protein
VGSVGLMMSVGAIIGGTSLAVILGLLTAVSPAQINEGFNLTNHTLVAIFTFIFVWACVSYIKSGKISRLLLLALSLGSVASAHYEAALMGTLAISAIIIRRPKIKWIALSIILAVLPFIPLVIFDLTHNYYNIRGIIEYSRFGQYKIYVPNRWLTYAVVFIPHLWGMVVGGTNISGYITFAFTIIVTAIAIKAKRINKLIVSIWISIAVMIFAIRFYRGERFESYFVFLHPFMLILSAWALWIFYKWKKIAGILLSGVLVVISIIPTVSSIIHSENFTVRQVHGWINVLTTKYPGEKFDMYDFKYNSTGKSIPLVLFMNHAGLISPSGRRIGFGVPPKSERPYHLEIKENNIGFDLWDLSSSSSAILQKNEWARINPENIYAGATEWYTNIH